MVVNAPNDGLCDNGLFCDGSETCDAVNDCQAGTPVDVDDGVSCTDDSCDETTDVVVNAPNDGLCDNGEFCDGSETCDATADCQAGTAPCDPASETCDEIGDTCEPIGCLSDAECDDAAFCNGAETCDLGTGECVPGTPVDVDDGVSCTDDSCDESTDVVVNAPNDGLCDNGQFCDGSETCDAVNDCQAGTPPVVDDSVGCTDDSCDEANDVVVNTTNDGLCDNGLFCDGSETCDAIADCQAGTAPVVDDGVGCTDDTCDEANDVVVNAPNDGLCDNGQFCDGSETCDATDDCQAGTAPCDPASETCNEAGDICEPIPNVPPTADAGGPYNGAVGVAVSFDGSGSVDTEGSIVAYDWNFGDGSTGTGVSPSNSYAVAGTYTVTLTVTDDGGLTSTDTTTATIQDTLPPGTVTIKEAKWESGDSKLEVRGDKSNPGETVDISNADTGEMIGTTLVKNDGKWKFAMELDLSPCRVRATIGNQFDERSVKDAPANCDDGTGPPPGMVTIKESKWESGDSRLVVKGIEAPPMEKVIITNAYTDEMIGSTRAKNSGEWKFERELELSPCRVRATIGNQFGEMDVKNAPANCSR